MGAAPGITATSCFIGGEWTGATSGTTFPVTNPATNQVLAEVADAGSAETTSAIDAASAAFPDWRARSVDERAALIARLANAVRRDEHRLAEILTAEQGKPIAEALGEIRYAAQFLDEAARHAPSLRDEPIGEPPPHHDRRAFPEPVGVCALITPWNFPTAMITRKLGPALAVGCTAVIKPSELTPLSALAIAELAVEAGMPPGVFNVVTGQPSPIGDTLLNDARVRKISFTGSTAVGQHLMRHAADNLQRLSLELGGNAPFIVFDDADLEIAIESSVASKFRNAGQTCICANRFLVQSGIHEEFMGRFKHAIESLRVADGSDPGAQIGPLISDDAIRAVEARVADAVDSGARVITGGRRAAVRGGADRFYAPTLIDGLTPGMRCYREEIFGPVAPVMTFDSEAEAVAIANDTVHGLAGYIMTRNDARASRVANALEFGVIGVNDGAPSDARAPFGGVKHSGFGREGGPHALREYTQWKYVSRRR